MMEKRELILRLRDLCPIQCLIFGLWFGLNTLPPLWWLQSCGRRVDPSVKHTFHTANQEHMKPQQAMVILLFQLWVWHTGMATQYGNCRCRCVSISICCFQEQNRNCWTLHYMQYMLHIYALSQIEVHKFWMPGCPGTKFLWWHLIFVGPWYGICFMSPFWYLEFWGGF